MSSRCSIEEIVDGETKRILILSGGGLPLKGTAWGGKQVVITTWYPGNTADATQQVLGPQEGPTQFQGEWHRNMLQSSGCLFLEEGVAVPIVTPIDLKNILEDICIVGHLLRVTWTSTGDREGQNHDEVRYGRAELWNFAFDSVDDVKWTVSFTWKSRTKAKKLTISREGDAPTLANKVSASLEAALLEARILNHHFTPPTEFSIGALGSLVDYPKKLVDRTMTSFRQLTSQFREVGGLIIKLKNTPLSVANSVLDAAQNTIAISNQFIDEIGRVPYELRTLKSKSSDIARASRRYGQIQDSVAVARERALEFVDALRRTVSRSVSNERDVIAVHITKIGDTPASISMKHYKNPDNGSEILRVNKLPWHQVEFRPGSVLIIPRIAAKNTNDV